MKVQPYASSEEGVIFDISFNTNEISFKIVELTIEEIDELLSDIQAQVYLLKDSYEED